VQLEDGIAYVAEAGRPLHDPGGAGSLALVPERHYQSVVDAAEACPGECIFIEMPVVAGRLPSGRHESGEIVDAVSVD